ncbi:MAG: UPF0182 family protein [Anaerolineae bacterium]|nr:UPF0182 family protein [Gemmatimonadaceae bacterium]
MISRRWAIIAVAVTAAILLTGRALATVYADYLWFAALDAQSLWRTRALVGTLGRFVYWLLLSAFVFANVYAVRRSVASLRIPRQIGNLEIPEEVSGRYLDAAALALSLILGAFLAFPFPEWSRIALPFLGIPFGESDPYLGADLGFFVYRLPFERSLRDRALLAILVAAATVIGLYALTPSLERKQGTLYVSNYVRRHLFALVALLILVLAWSYRLDAYSLLIDGSGVGGAFTYADHRANLAVRLALSLVAAAAAALVAWAGWTGQVRIALTAVGILLLLSLSLRNGAPFLARRWARTLDPIARERPYLAARDAYTRRAYAVDRISRGDSMVPLGNELLATAASVWDLAAIGGAVAPPAKARASSRVLGWEMGRSGLSVIAPYGPVGDAGNSSYWRLDRYSAASVSSRGEPVSLPSSLPDGEESLATPVVFDSAVGYALIADSSGSVAAPTLNTLAARLAFAWTLQNHRLLAGDLPHPDPRIVTWRDLRTRLTRLFPFFRQGDSVAPLVEGDTLFWIVELYAASPSYPLSQRMALGETDVSYVHHAATAIVNSRTGRVTLASAAAQDRLTETWTRAFPDMFVSREALRPSIAEALPPHREHALIQAATFASVGTRNSGPRAGFVPRADGSDSALASGDRTLFASATTPSALAWSTPILDSGDGLLGLIIALGGDQPATQWFPYDSTGVTWHSLVEAMQRPPDSLAEITRGTVLGPVRGIPTRIGPLFVQTTYTWRLDSPPLMRRVTLRLPDGSIRHGSSVAQAAGFMRVEADSSGPATRETFEERVRALYMQMRSTLARGDLEGFGKAYRALGDLLARTPAAPPAPQVSP